MKVGDRIIYKSRDGLMRDGTLMAASACMIGQAGNQIPALPVKSKEGALIVSASDCWTVTQQEGVLGVTLIPVTPNMWSSVDEANTETANLVFNQDGNPWGHCGSWASGEVRNIVGAFDIIDQLKFSNLMLKAIIVGMTLGWMIYWIANVGSR